MDYFIGAIATLITVAIVNRLITRQILQQKKTVVRYSQSHIYKVADSMIFGVSQPKAVDSQSNRYKENIYQRIVLIEDKAYWIKDNGFYVADIIDGDIDKDTERQVDIMAMDDVELKKMMFIVEALKEGKDDSWDSGKS